MEMGKLIEITMRGNIIVLKRHRAGPVSFSVLILPITPAIETVLEMRINDFIREIVINLLVAAK